MLYNKKKYLIELVKISGIKLPLLLILDLFLGLVNGVGIIMIIPFLKIAGMDDGGTHSKKITVYVEKVFNYVGLELNIYMVIAVYIIIVSSFAVLKKYQSVLSVVIQQNFIKQTRNRLYKALIHSNWLFVKNRKVSDITHVLTADIQKLGAGTISLLKTVSLILFVGFYIGTAYYLSFSMTLFSLLIGGVLGLITKPLLKKSIQTGNVYRNHRKKLYNAFIQQIEGIKIIKSLGLEDLFNNKVSKINNDAEREMIRVTNIHTNTKMLYEISGVLAVSFYLIVSISILGNSFHDVLIFIIILSRLLPGFASITQQIQNIGNTLPSFDGIVELHSAAECAEEKLTKLKKQNEIPLNHSIIFKQVLFRYPEKKDYIIKDMDLIIPAKKITALIGSSGAGKSTVIDLILGLIKPLSGKIEFDGKALSDDLIYCWRQNVGYVTQDVFLFNETIRSNLLWGAPNSNDDHIMEVLQKVNLYETVKKLPNGLDFEVGDKGLNFSGGERQRLALARTLLRKSQLLILDEATSSLDAENEKIIFNLIQSLKNYMTIIVISHKLSILRYADNVILLEEGVIKKNDIISFMDN